MNWKKNIKLWLIVAVSIVLIPAALYSVQVLGYQDLQIISAPANPPSGFLRFSAQTGALGCLTSAGANCLAGIGSPLTTKGDIYTFGSSNARLGVGTNTFVLTANSAATNGIDWEAAGVCATCTVTVGSGTITLNPGAVASASCSTAATVTISGTATTDNVMVDFAADPTGTTGYTPSASGMITIIKYPTANTVNVKACNNTSASITPGSVTLNARVVR